MKKNNYVNAQPTIKKNEDIFEPLVDIQTLVNHLGIPRKTIYKWAYEHITTGFPFYKVGRHLKFRLSEVDCWLRTFHWSDKK